MKCWRNDWNAGVFMMLNIKMHRSPFVRIQRRLLGKIHKSEKTKCNYANQTEKSKTVRRLCVMRKRRKCWKNLWEVFFYRYVCFELVFFSGCVWKSCMLRLGLIRKFTLAHVEFQHCSTCQCFFFLRKALIVFVIAFLHRNNNVYRIDR